MKWRIFGTLVVVAFAGPGRAQDFDIDGYCRDMAHVNQLGTDWRQRCVANLEVQQKYQKQVERRARGSSEVDDRIRENNLIIAYLKLRDAEKATKGEEQKLVTARLDMLLAVECPAVMAPAKCSDLRKDRAEQNHR